MVVCRANWIGVSLSWLMMRLSPIWFVLRFCWAWSSSWFLVWVLLR